MNDKSPSIGMLLRDWRQRRRQSQLDLAAGGNISQRHLSFIESGRSQPSREMVLRLADALRVPMRERNALLVAAGYAPVFRERAFDDPGFAQARRAVELILDGHAPYPALAVDRHWNLLLANRPAMLLMANVAPALLAPPVNVLRLSLHPAGLAPHIRNFAEWRGHLLTRLARQIEDLPDAGLENLLAELKGYRRAGDAMTAPREDLAGIAVPLELATPAGVLAFISTTTVFGTAVDVSLAELAVESFFPANRDTAEAMRALLAKA